MTSRVKYPSRNGWLREQVGLERNPVVVKTTEQDRKYKALCDARNCLYCRVLVVEGLEDFKRKFNVRIV